MLASLLALWLSTTPPATQIRLPERPVQPNGWVHGRGACVLLSLRQLGTVALTTDDGKSFRFLAFPRAFRAVTGFTCWEGQYFALGDRAGLFRLERDGFERVALPDDKSESRFHGLVPFGNKLYVGTGNRLFTSTDAGRTFTPALPGVSALASDGTTLIAARAEQVFSVDSSDQMLPLAKLPKPVKSLSITASRWFATLENGALHYSEDRGNTWKRDGGAPPGIDQVLQLDSTFVANVQYRVWFRKPGASWQRVPTNTSLIVPAETGVWRMEGGGPIFRAASVGDVGTRFSLPSTPLPSVRFLAANANSIVTALNYAPEVLVSNDLGRSWNAVCPNADFRLAALDGPRLQLQGPFGGRSECKVPGFKTRNVLELPDETCNGDLCVRFGGKLLLRTRDRGKTWQELPASIGDGRPIIAAAGSGREILIARGKKHYDAVYNVPNYEAVFRSTDDGKTFVPFTLPEAITSFAPSERGWLVGTHLHGIALVPYAPSAAPRK